MKESALQRPCGLEQKQALVGTWPPKLRRDDRGQTATTVDHPDYAARVAHDVVDGMAERGVLVCGTGIGTAACRQQDRRDPRASDPARCSAALAREH